MIELHRESEDLLRMSSRGVQRVVWEYEAFHHVRFDRDEDMVQTR